MRRRNDSGNTLESILELCGNILQMLNREYEAVEYMKERPSSPNRWTIPEGIRRKALARDQKVIDDMLRSSSYINEYARLLHDMHAEDNSNSRDRLNSFVQTGSLSRGRRRKQSWYK